MELVALVVFAVVVIVAAVRGPAGSRGTSDPDGEGGSRSDHVESGAGVWEPDVPEPVPRAAVTSVPSTASHPDRPPRPSLPGRSAFPDTFP